MAKLYQKHMPHVDRYNDRHQSTNISMGYCRQRYTRALFIGFHLAMLVCNTVTIVCWLIPAAVLGKLKPRTSAASFASRRCCSPRASATWVCG